MNNSCKKRNLIICVYLVFLVCELGGVATRVEAQSAAAPPVSRSDSANQPADEDLANRVKTALHIDPYFYDKHVTVSVNAPVVGNLSIKEGGR